MMNDYVGFVQQLYDHFVQRNTTALLDMMDENIVWRQSIPDDIFGPREFAGKHGVLNYLKLLSEQVLFESFIPRNFFSTHLFVAVYGDEQYRINKTGQLLDLKWFHLFEIKNNKLIRFEEYTDNHRVAKAFEGSGQN